MKKTGKKSAKKTKQSPKTTGMMSKRKLPSPIKVLSAKKQPMLTLKAESPAYSPVEDVSRKCYLIPAKIVNAQTTLSGRTIQIPHRTSMMVQTGVTAEIPDGYRLSVRVCPELSRKGLYAAANVNTLYSSGQVLAWVINVGRDLVILNDGDIFLEVRMEQVPDYAIHVEVQV